MAKLAEPVKEYIVQRLACFDRPSEVVEAVKEEYGVIIPRQQVEVYDPEKGCKVKKWVALHAATRKAFLDQKAGIAIGHQAWRQREREDLVRRAKKQKNYKLVAEILDAAAKEESDYYGTTKGGTITAETEEQRVQRMHALFRQMDEATLGTSAPALTVANGGAAA